MSGTVEPKRQKLTSNPPNLETAIVIEGNLNCVRLRKCADQHRNMIFLRHIDLSQLTLPIRRVIFGEIEQFQSTDVGIISCQIERQKYVVTAVSSPSIRTESHLELALRNLLKVYEEKPISGDDELTKPPTIISSDQLQYWRTVLEKTEINLDLPNYHRRNTKDEHFGQFTFRISSDVKTALLNFCRESENAPAVAMLAIFLAFVYRYTQQNSFCIIASIASHLKNSVYFPAEMSSDYTLVDVMLRIKSKLLEISSHDHIPSHAVKVFLRSESTLSFTYTEEYSTEELNVSSYPAVSKAPLALHVTEQRNHLNASFFYDQVSFAHDAVERMSGHFRNIVYSASRSPAQKIVLLPMLMPTELTRFELWNRTEDEFNGDLLIHRLIERQVVSNPNETSLVDDHQRLSYAAVNARSNQLALHLRSIGIEQNCTIAVYMEKSINSIISFIGILKSGNAYAPIDPHAPKSRAARVLSDLNPALVITTRQFKNELPIDLPYLVFDEIALNDRLWENLPCNITPSSTAYVLFTSGTTGVPKGVITSHKNVVAMLHAMQKFFNPEDSRGILISAAPNFCLFHAQVFYALTTGSKGILVESILHSADLPVRNEITFVVTPPAGFYQIMRSRQLPSSLKVVVLGGDVIKPEMVRELRQYVPDVKIYSCHGCTEATFLDLCGAIDGDISEAIDAGKPVANMKVYVVDKSMQLVPTYFVGELCVSGPQVTKGYLNLPDITASRYIKNPFANDDENYDVMYRTGDVARWIEDGRIQICGRMDFMVKINGIRVELGEIENALSQHPAVKDVVVTATAREDGTYLSAYLVLERFPPPTDEQFRLFLNSKIPHYMIPRYYRVIERMPRNPNGKIDRNLLPKFNLDVGAKSSSHEIISTPTGLQLEVTSVVNKLLNRQVTVRDNLIACGLDSITATQLSIHLETTLKIRLPVPFIFEHPTILGLSQNIQVLLRGVDLPPAEFDPTKDSILHDDVLPNTPPFADESVEKNVFLTGSTGFLGAFLLVELLAQTDARIHCLVRGENPQTARQRLEKNLVFYNLWQDEFESRISTVSGDLSKPKMGIDSTDYRNLCLLIDTIYHCAATVNFVLPYSALRIDATKSMEEILRFAFESKLKPFHYISSVSVHGTRPRHASVDVKSIIYENASIDAAVAYLPDMGYAKMKWISEKLVHVARSRGLPVTIFRPSYVFCHRKIGSVSTQEYAIRLIRDCIKLKMYPDSRARLQLIPVDYVSKVAVAISNDRNNFGKTFHLTPRADTEVRLIMEWLKQYGYEIAETNTKNWLRELDNYYRENNDSAGLKPLLRFVDENLESSGDSLWRFDDSNVQNVFATRESSEIDFSSVKLMLDFLVRINYLQRPKLNETIKD